MEALRTEVQNWFNDLGAEIVAWATLVQEPAIYLVLGFVVVAGLAYFLRLIDRRSADRFIQEKSSVLMGLFVLFVVVNILISLANARLGPAALG